MEVTFYGTRGSVPISNRESVEIGGNTTCVRIASDCLPPDTWLVVDAGSGFVPLCRDALTSGVKNVHILFSHWHHDHNQGLFLEPLTFIKQIPITLWGPVENGYGPRKVIETLMKPPFFPVDFKVVGSHFTTKPIAHPDITVVVFHPKGGVKQMNVEELERLQNEKKPIPFRHERYYAEECLIIKMLWSNHPERTICYRFEEGPTGKVFVFLTDHENMDGMPGKLRAHLNGANFLVMDSQYSRQKYEQITAGFGHGTPDYAVEVALAVNAERLGLTHHDPLSTDQDIEDILKHAQACLCPPDSDDPPRELDIFVCKDYLKVTV
ncbi:MBL fold metallo-hydrolase [Patescibacteria group bacterium]